jgi:DNA-directed RNA polymerase subunit RPC12/RpoP
MKPVGIYKKCMRCGRREEVELERIKCPCGGHLYIIGTIYQERTVKAQKGEKHGC